MDAATTKIDLICKIQQLEGWLHDNSEHSNYLTILADLNGLKNKLENIEKLDNRNEYLTLSLQYDTQVERKFTPGERIAINQEKSSNINLIKIEADHFKDFEWVTTVSKEIEIKLEEIHKQIKAKNWHPIPYDTY